MSRIFLSTVCTWLILSSFTFAQELMPPDQDAVLPAPPPAAPQPADQWNSDNLPQLTNRQLAVQQKAAWKAEQRRRRLEAYRWAGYSPSRPPASPIPVMGAPSNMVAPVRVYALPGILYQPRPAVTFFGTTAVHGLPILPLR